MVQRHADHIHKRTTSRDDVELSEELEDVPSIPVSSQPVEQEAPVQPTTSFTENLKTTRSFSELRGSNVINKLVTEL